MILAIDTSTKSFSIAILNSSRILGEIYLDIGLRHSELLYKYMDSLMKETQVSVQDINKIACTTGPGSFTGIRIGLSAGRTMAQLLNVPLVGISTLDVLVGNVISNIYVLKTGRIFVCVMMKGAGREIYAAVYELKKSLNSGTMNFKRLTSYMVVEKESFIEEVYSVFHKRKSSAIIFVGNASESFRDLINLRFDNRLILSSPTFSIPRASVLGILSLGNKGTKYHKVKPLYVTPPRIRPPRIPN